METGTAKQVIEKIESQGKQRAKKKDPVVFATMNIGDHHWQGDVAVLKVESVPEGLEKWQPGAQLAEGVTRGSRHEILPEHVAHCEVLTPPADSNALTGPFVRASQPWELTHPDHGHATFPAGDYSIRYQRQFGEEIRRVVD